MSSAAPPRSPRSRRSAWPFYLALGLIFAALPVGYFFFLGTPPPPPLPPPPPPVEARGAMDLQLSEINGQVEIRHGGGDWAAAQKGETLQRSDAVRTGDGSSAVLAGGREAYLVRMEPGTEVSVDELTDSISRVLLENGMATAEVNAAARHTFEVKAAEARARTQAGKFAISNNGAGMVAVGAQSGEVAFQSKDKTVIVRAGQQSIARPGEAPTEPAAAPNSLLLKVRWPSESVVRNRTILLAGQVEPGALLVISGKRIKVDSKGYFSEHFNLKEGDNPFDVQARTVGGLEQRETHRVKRDTKVDTVEVDVDWGEKRKKN